MFFEICLDNESIQTWRIPFRSTFPRKERFLLSWFDELEVRLYLKRKVELN